MLLFGHTGIAIGVTWFLESRGYLARYLGKDEAASLRTEATPETTMESNKRQLRQKVHFYGLVLFGSMLPDIFDKPVGLLFWKDYFGNGRIFGHTLVFALAILLAGLFLKIRNKGTWLLVFGWGSLLHLVLDKIWLRLSTLLWPLYGVQFEKEQVTNFAAKILSDLTHDAWVYIPEIVGVIILAVFGIRILHEVRIVLSLSDGYYTPEAS